MNSHIIFTWACFVFIASNFTYNSYFKIWLIATRHRESVFQDLDVYPYLDGQICGGMSRAKFFCWNVPLLTARSRLLFTSSRYDRNFNRVFYMIMYTDNISFFKKLCHLLSDRPSWPYALRKRLSPPSSSSDTLCIKKLNHIDLIWYKTVFFMDTVNIISN